MPEVTVTMPPMGTPERRLYLAYRRQALTENVSIRLLRCGWLSTRRYVDQRNMAIHAWRSRFEQSRANRTGGRACAMAQGLEAFPEFMLMLKARMELGVNLVFGNSLAAITVKPYWFADRLPK